LGRSATKKKFILSSTCFGGNTAHHQEPKIAVVAVASSKLNVQQPFTYAKPEDASAVLGS